MTGNCKNLSTRFTFTPENLKRRAKHGFAKECREPYRHPLVLAYEFQGLLDAGVINNRAEIARLYGLSRARVTQVMNLLRLPPSAQDYISSLPPQEQRLFSGRRLGQIVGLPNEVAQLAEFDELRRTAPES